MTAGLDLVAAAITAAGADDLDTLRRLVDWPLTGAAQIVAGLSDVSEQDRSAAVASGLAELHAAQQDTTLVEDILRPLAAILAATQEVRPTESAAALAALRVPPLTVRGLTDDQVAELERLRTRVAALAEVYQATGAAGEVSLVHGAGADQLVLVLDEGWRASGLAGQLLQPDQGLGAGHSGPFGVGRPVGVRAELLDQGGDQRA